MIGRPAGRAPSAASPSDTGSGTRRLVGPRDDRRQRAVKIECEQRAQPHDGLQCLLAFGREQMLHLLPGPNTLHPASAMTPHAASLDLALIGNCAISALVDKRGAIVWCCMPRFDGDPIFHSLLDSDRRRAAGRRVQRRAGRLRALGAGLRPEHRRCSHAALRRRRRRHRDRRFLPALPQPRSLLQAGPDRAQGAAADRPPAGSLHRPPARAVGYGDARDHPRQQSSALHPAGRRAEAEHQRAARPTCSTAPGSRCRPR